MDGLADLPWWGWVGWGAVAVWLAAVLGGLVDRD